MRKSVLIVLLACWTAPVGAIADANEMVFSGGLASSVHHDGVHLKDSFAGSIAYFRRLHPWVAAGLEGGLFLGGKYGGAVPTAIDSDGDGNADSVRFEENAFGATLQLTPQIKLGPILGRGRVCWQPYVVGGGGFYRVIFARVGGAPGSLSSQSNHGGFNWGGGATVFFGDFGIGAELRFHQVIDRGQPDTLYRVPSLQLHLLF